MNNTYHRTIAGIVLIACGGCATSVAEFESASPQLEESMPENYKVIYERVFRAARRCYVTSGLTSSSEVEAQLFPQLGYGELFFTFINMGMKDPVSRVRVDRVDTGSRISITTTGVFEGVQADRRTKLLSGAQGSEAC